MKHINHSCPEICDDNERLPSLISSDNSETSVASTTRNPLDHEIMTPSTTLEIKLTSNNQRKSRYGTPNVGNSVDHETPISLTRTGIIHTSNEKRRSKSGASASTVTFSTVEIRSFPMILGDNPSCGHDGPPLTISWEPEEFRKVLVDRYEKCKEKKGRKRMSELKIGGFFRQRLLNRSGVCTRDDIFNRMEEMEEIRRKRNRSKRLYLFRLKITRFFYPQKKANNAQAV